MSSNSQLAPSQGPSQAPGKPGGPSAEMELLAYSVQQLQSAKQKFRESGDALLRQKENQKGTPMLVPLTSSMYVEGKLDDPNSFFVDIGTGYFVEKNYQQASEYFNRKVKFLDEQIDNYLKLMQEKQQQQAS